MELLLKMATRLSRPSKRRHAAKVTSRRKVCDRIQIVLGLRGESAKGGSAWRGGLARGGGFDNDDEDGSTAFEKRGTSRGGAGAIRKHGHCEPDKERIAAEGGGKKGAIPAAVREKGAMVGAGGAGAGGAMYE